MAKNYTITNYVLDDGVDLIELFKNPAYAAMTSGVTQSGTNYIAFENGFRICWGWIIAYTAPIRINLPLPMIAGDSSFVYAYDNDGYHDVSPYVISNTQLEIDFTGGQTSIQWIALGYY